jgi:uncharacterized protein YbaR (Trm112 family)
MQFDRQLLQVLACPECQGKLVDYPQAHTRELVCRFDRLAFPIVDGTPILIASRARSLTLQELEHIPT